MINLFAHALSFLITCAIVLFALSNSHIVEVFTLPGEMGQSYELPLFLVALTLMGLGFFLGSCAVWLNYGGVRRDRRAKKRAIKNLEQEVAALQTPDNQTDTMPESDFFPAIPDSHKGGHK